jgi:hypothetical protein
MPAPTETAPADDQELKDDLKGLKDDLKGLLSGGDSVAIQVDDEGPKMEEFSFVLPPVPGGDFQDEIEEPAEIVVDEPEEIEIESDPWKWVVSSFLSWLQRMMQGVPRHSGRDTAGLERAISYLEALDREISKAVRSDLNCEIAIDAVEKAREEIHKGLDRLHERLDKVQESKYPRKKKKTKTKKKSEDESDDLVKEASKAAKFTVIVPLFISSMARTCINSAVSAGKDIEDCFQKLSNKFGFTPREEAELVQLLHDMGYPLRRPRGYLLDEEVDATSTDNLDWSAQYPA